MEYCQIPKQIKIARFSISETAHPFSNTQFLKHYYKQIFPQGKTNFETNRHVFPYPGAPLMVYCLIFWTLAKFCLFYLNLEWVKGVGGTNP